MKKILVVVAAIALLTSMSAFAATGATNTNTVSPTLTVSANIQKAVSLTLATGTVAATHCAVAAGGGPPDYTMNFGNVDALGISAGGCNKINPATPGTTNAIYWSDYNLLPVFTSQNPSAAATISAYVSTNFATANISVLRSTVATAITAPVVPADMTAMSTLVGTPDVIGAAGVASGTTLTRFIGVGVAPTNGAALTGVQTATVTFTLTVN